MYVVTGLYVVNGMYDCYCTVKTPAISRYQPLQAALKKNCLAMW